MRAFAILSGEGLSFFDAFSVLEACGIMSPSNVIIISDRECPALYIAMERGFQTELIENSNNTSFSRKAYNVCSTFSAEFGILSFSRLVTVDLFGRIRTFNVHPALLPAYKGLGALRKAMNDKVRFIGATLHAVTEDVDSGPIVAQAVSPICADWDEENLRRVSYIQKIYLFLSLFWLLGHGFFDYNFREVIWKKSTRCTYTCNPSIDDPCLKSHFSYFQKNIGMECLLL